ncbi:MAG: ABC transporter permease, partial [Acetobacteraceae bacterium]
MPQGAALAWLILLVVFIISVAINRNFMAWHTMRLQLIQAAFVGLIAVGQTLAILIGQIDLSVPWTITLSAVLGSNLYAAHPSLVLPFAVAIVIGVGVGLINALGVHVLRVHSLVWTLSVNLMLQGITLIYTNAAAPTTHV